MRRIVTVAIGVPGTHPIRNKDDLKDAGSRKVRRYLHGLVGGLNRRGYRFGEGAADNEFVIDFVSLIHQASRVQTHSETSTG